MFGREKKNIFSGVKKKKIPFEHSGVVKKKTLSPAQIIFPPKLHYLFFF